MTNYFQVATTTDSAEAAQHLATSAVAARLAACGQVEGPVTSVYWWDGAVQTSREWRCVLKTTAARYPALEQHLRAEHSYDVAEIIATPVVAGSAPYLAWLSAETGS